MKDKRTPLQDPTGFWKTKGSAHTHLGGYVTFAETERSNRQFVYQWYYEPKSILDEPYSTYRVFPGIQELPDDCDEDTCLVFLLEKHINSNLEALSLGEFEVWSQMVMVNFV